MFRKITILPLFFAPLFLFAQFDDPRIPSVRKEPPRTEFTSYNRRDDAVTFNPDKSDFYLPLNGNWEFIYHSLDNGADINVDYLTGKSSADSSPVPGAYAAVFGEELEKVKPPTIPKDNGIGLYRAFVDIPVGWLDRDIYIRISGIRSGAALYINGNMAGYAENSAVPAEFNISKFISDGRNTIVVAVYKWTTGSWLENENTSSAGIETGVYFYSQPKVHVEDFRIRTSADATYTKGFLELDVFVVNNFNYTNKAEIWFDLMDRTGKIIRYDYKEIEAAGMGGKDTVNFVAEVPNVNLWTTDQPYLYDLMIRVKFDGRFIEYIPYKTGFVDIDISDNFFMENGKELELTGTDFSNRVSFLSDKEIKEILSDIKKQGINLITYNGCSDKKRLYDICAELGILVNETVNIDTSFTGQSKNEGGSLGNNPLWINSYLDRTESSFYNYRNFVNILDFSIPEKAGTGYNIYKSRQKIKEMKETSVKKFNY